MPGAARLTHFLLIFTESALDQTRIPQSRLIPAMQPPSRSRHPAWTPDSGHIRSDLHFRIRRVTPPPLPQVLCWKDQGGYDTVILLAGALKRRKFKGFHLNSGTLRHVLPLFRQSWVISHWRRLGTHDSSCGCCQPTAANSPVIRRAISCWIHYR